MSETEVVEADSSTVLLYLISAFIGTVAGVSMVLLAYALTW